MCYLLLDEPDNVLDVEAKRWLEGELATTRKTVLYVSHDRELLAATATKIVTVEAEGSWTHGGGFAGYGEARRSHLNKLERDRTLYDNERKRLDELVAEMRRRATISEVFAPKLNAAESRLRQRRARGTTGARPRAAHQHASRWCSHRQAGAHHRATRTRWTHRSFHLEIDFGDRVAVLGGNGVGKSHFLRLLTGDESVAHSGTWRLGAGVVPGLFHQTHEHPEWTGRTLSEILHDHDVVRGPAMSMLRRYEINAALTNRSRRC